MKGTLFHSEWGGVDSGYRMIFFTVLEPWVHTVKGSFLFCRVQLGSGFAVFISFLLFSQTPSVMGFLERPPEKWWWRRPFRGAGASDLYS